MQLMKIAELISGYEKFKDTKFKKYEKQYKTDYTGFNTCAYCFLSKCSTNNL